MGRRCHHVPWRARDDLGNCEVEHASIRFVDGSGQERQGSVVDIHLRTQE